MLADIILKMVSPLVRRLINKHSIDGSIILLYGLSNMGIIPKEIIPSIEGVSLTQILLGMLFLLAFKYLYKKTSN